MCGRGGPAGRTHNRDPGLQWAHETNLDATGQGSWREIPLFSSPLGNDATSGTTGSAPNDPASWTARGTLRSVREGLLAQQLRSESTGEIRTRSPDDPDGVGEIAGFEGGRTTFLHFPSAVFLSDPRSMSDGDQ